MTVLVEVGIPADRFALGRSLTSPGTDLELGLERVVPVREVVPYVWATGEPGAVDGLTERLEASAAAVSVAVLDRLTADGADRCRQLYRVDWRLDELDLVAEVVDGGGAILEGSGTGGRWQFRFRFPDHERVARFHRRLTERDLTGFTVRRIRSLDRRTDRDEEVALTPQQREALVLAARCGYFSTPRQVTLAELGDRLDISEQAVSQRLRRATEEVVLSTLGLPDPPA
jgi:predicted DNA binding protein